MLRVGVLSLFLVSSRKDLLNLLGEKCCPVRTVHKIEIDREKFIIRGYMHENVIVGHKLVHVLKRHLKVMVAENFEFLAILDAEKSEELCVQADLLSSPV